MADASGVVFGAVKARKGGRRKRRREGSASALEVRHCAAFHSVSLAEALAGTPQDDGTRVVAPPAAGRTKASTIAFQVGALALPLRRCGAHAGADGTQTAGRAKAARSSGSDAASSAGAEVLGAVASSGDAITSRDDVATAERRFDTAAEADATAAAEREVEADGGLVATSKDAMRRKKAFGTLGPMRAPSNVRASNVMDYQPDVCKDYFETGYCGWGDSCKFLHMREKFTAGWKQEAEWQAKQRAREAALSAGLDVGEGGGGGGGDSEKAEVPFACFLCRVPFTQRWTEARAAPVVSTCGHYTCEPCALARYRKDTTCAVCGAESYGVFNRATAVLARMAEEGVGPTAAPAPAPAPTGGWGAETLVTPAAAPA